jgi:hypothetical protein
MKDNETLKAEDQKLKIVFINESNPDEKPLEMYFTLERIEDVKVTTLGIDSSLFSKETKPSLMNALYMDTVNVLGTVKNLFDAGKSYEGLYILTREEYKEYVTKVLGLKIED